MAGCSQRRPVALPALFSMHLHPTLRPRSIPSPPYPCPTLPYPAPPHFAAPCKCPATSAKGTCVLTSSSSPVFSQPCASAAAKVGSLGKCKAFQWTGRRQAISCAGQVPRMCYAEVDWGGGQRAWVPDHLCTASASNIGTASDPKCEGETTGTQSVML